MDAITFIAEERIRQAQEEGVFDNLPGAGKPVDLSAEANLPQELRMAYTLLKNSGHLREGFVPDQGTMLQYCLPEAEAQAYAADLRLEVLLKKAGRAKESPGCDAYHNQLCARVGRRGL